MSFVVIVCAAMLVASVLIWVSSLMAAGWVADRRIKKIIKEVEDNADL